MAKILIVDDQESFLTTLEQILTVHQHSVRKVNNGFDAAEILKSEDFDVLITDAIMPGCTGYDLVGIVRKSIKLKSLPVIMLTGKRDSKDILKSIAAGVNDYVLKPVQPHVLISKLDSVLIKKKTSQPSLVNLTISETASWNDNTSINEISEIGLTLISNFSIAVGSLTTLESELFAHINIKKPSLRVIECAPASKQVGFFTVKLLFEKISAGDLENIRRWILLKSAVKAN